jgi:hypothetical protein
MPGQSQRHITETRNPSSIKDSTRPFDPMMHQETKDRQKRVTPKYREYTQVRITRKIGREREQKVAEFAREHISEYKGEAEEHPGMPHMIFEREADAHAFAHKLHSKLGVPKEHIEVKAHSNKTTHH